MASWVNPKTPKGSQIAHSLHVLQGNAQQRTKAPTVWQRQLERVLMQTWQPSKDACVHNICCHKCPERPTHKIAVPKTVQAIASNCPIALLLMHSALSSAGLSQSCHDAGTPLPYTELGYSMTRTRPPCHIHHTVEKCNLSKKIAVYTNTIGTRCRGKHTLTRDMGGRFLLNCARTTPTLPWGLVTCKTTEHRMKHRGWANS